MITPEEWEAMDPWGPLHIIVSDGNLEDSHITFCEYEEGITEAERAFCKKLRAMSEDEREASWDAWVYGPPGDE